MFIKKYAFFVPLFCLFVFSSAKAGNITWWKNEDLKISFAYSPVWKEVNASESATAVVINWIVKNDTLVATCYLQTANDGDLSKLPADMLHSRSKEIIKSFVNNTKKRASQVRILEEKETFIDGLPAIYLVSEVLIKTLNKDTRLKTWTIITTWGQKEMGLA